MSFSFSSIRIQYKNSFLLSKTLPLSVAKIFFYSDFSKQITLLKWSFNIDFIYILFSLPGTSKCDFFPPEALQG